MRVTYYRAIFIAMMLGSGAIFADAPIDDDEAFRVLVSIPNFCGGVEFRGSLLGLQPNTNNLNYAILTNPLPLLSPNWHIKKIRPSYRAAFDVGVGYVFCDTANDLRVDWTHLRANDADSVSTQPFNSITPYYQIGQPNIESILYARGESKFHYDIVNIDVGQFVDVGSSLQTRFFAGLHYLYLKETRSATFSDAAFSSTGNNISQFKGIGSRFGIAAAFDLCNGFGLVAQVAGIASIGRVKARMDFTSTSMTLDEVDFGINHQSISTDNITRIVPGGEAKLGLSYLFPYGRDFILKFETGYQVAAYANVIREVYPNSLAIPLQTGAVVASTMGESQSDFTLNGLYFTVAVKI